MQTITAKLATAIAMPWARHVPGGVSDTYTNTEGDGPSFGVNIIQDPAGVWLIKAGHKVFISYGLVRTVEYYPERGVGSHEGYAEDPAVTKAATPVAKAKR